MRFRTTAFRAAGTALLALILAAPVVLARPVTGLVIRDGAEVLVTVNGSSVTGVLEVAHEETTAPLTVTFLDDLSLEFTPTAPDTTMGGSIADPLTATYIATAGFEFEVTGVEEGVTSLTLTLTDGGGMFYTSPQIEVHVEEEHLEADGLVIRREGQLLVHVWRGAVDGFLHVVPGSTSDTLEITFLDTDSVEFHPEPPDFTLETDVADPMKATTSPVGDWDFVLNGDDPGPTSMTVCILHEGHCDFTSPDIPVLVSLLSAAGDPAPRPPVARLLPPAPNPFRDRTRFEMSLPASGPVALRLYDATGRLVRTLFDGSAEQARAALEWDGQDDQGRPVSSGVYFVRLETAVSSDTRRVQFLR